jgi:hypothetical protein
MGGLGKAIPRTVEFPVSPQESRRNLGRSSFFRIDIEFVSTYRSEGFPAAALRCCFKCLRLVEPKEEIPNGIGHSKLVEIVRVEPTSAQWLDIYLCEQRQSAQHCLFRVSVAGDF